MAFIRSSPWSDAANYGQGLGEILTQLLFHLPQLRAQQALLAAHQNLYGDGAEQRYYEERTGEVSSAEKAKQQLGDALWSISMAQARGIDITPHVSRAVDAMGRLPDKDRSDLAKNLAQMLEMSSPRFRQALGTGQHAVLPVASQGSLYDTVTGMPSFQMPQKLAQGSSLVPATGGPAIAFGPEKPLALEHLGSVYGAFARSAAQNALLEGKDPQTALSDFLERWDRGRTTLIQLSQRHRHELGAIIRLLASSNSIVQFLNKTLYETHSLNTRKRG